MKEKLWKRRLYVGLIGIMLVYAFALIKIVLLKSGFTTELRSIQYIPFSFVKDLSNPEAGIDIVLKNVLGNFAIFIPLGILLPLFIKKLSFSSTVLTGFITSLSIELLQYIVGFGMTDIDDLILNTLGCALGAGLYFGLFSRSKKFLHAELISFTFLAVFGCFGVLSLWLYQPSALPARIAYENEEVFGETDRDSYTISAFCNEIEDGRLMLRQDSIYPNTAGTRSYSDSSYAFAEDVLIIEEHHSFKYSPNGNIQKTIVSYEVGSAEKASEDIKLSDGTFSDIWLNDNDECVLLVYTINETK